MTGRETEFSDAELTGYLDGALPADKMAAIDRALADDDALAERMMALDIPLAEIRQAMDPALLAAPAMPAHLKAAADPAPAVRAAKRGGLSSWLMPAAIAASFAAGVWITPIVRPDKPPLPVATTGGWIDTIASYQSLYVAQTLEGPAASPAQTEAVLAAAEDAIGVAMAPATQVANMQFKRAQILGFKGKPLLQMAYITPDGTPLALCVIPVSGEDRGAKTTVNHGMTGVSWVENGVGYLLIGGSDAEAIEALSAQVQAVI